MTDLKWTKQKPTANGWYWVRITSAVDASVALGEVVQMIGFDEDPPWPRFYMTQERIPTYESEWDESFEWAGPLPRPESP